MSVPLKVAPDQAIPLEQVRDKYKVRCILVRAELEFCAENGLSRGSAMTGDMVCWAAEIPPVLAQFLKAHGIDISSLEEAAQPSEPPQVETA